MTKKKIALTLSLALLITALSGCSEIDRPSHSDFVGANFLLLESPVQLQTEIGLVTDNVVMYYSTVLTACGSESLWDGVATVFFENIYFKQVCTSQTTAAASGKEWRGGWAVSNTKSPVLQIQGWLQDIADDEGHYSKDTILPENLSEFFSGYDDPVYRITLPEKQVDWDALCDAEFDSLFGGDNLLASAGDADVTMLFNIDTLELEGIYITATDTAWLEAAIIITQASEAPNISVDMDALEEGTLSEEWAISGFASEG